MKNIRLVSTSAVLVVGGLLASSIATNTHSANASVEDYETNAATISGDQQNTDFINRVGAKQLANDLRRGGYVVYLRHARTNKDWGDQVSTDLNLADCNTQRRLSPDGKKETVEIGRGIKAARVPVGDVIFSDYCRAYNTAQLAIGKYKKI